MGGLRHDRTLCYEAVMPYRYRLDTLFSSCGLKAPAFGLVLVVSSLAFPAASAAEPVDRSSLLQQRVNDLAYQLDLIKPFDRSKGDSRLQELQQAITAWNDADRHEADFEVMEAWLQEATQASLPGSRDRMPPAPRFASPHLASPRGPLQPVDTTVVKPVDAPVVESVPPVPAPDAIAPLLGTSRPMDLGNPFVDDPVAIVREDQEAEPVQPPPPVQPPLVHQVSTEQDDLRGQGSAEFPKAEVSEINMAELRAQVHGYAYGLRGVEAKLLANPTMPTDQLLLVTRELHQLVSQRVFLSLYFEALSKGKRADEKSRDSVLPSPHEAQAMIAARVADWKRAGSQDAPFDSLFAEATSSVREEIEAMLDQM